MENVPYLFIQSLRVNQIFSSLLQEFVYFTRTQELKIVPSISREPSFQNLSNTFVRNWRRRPPFETPFHFLESETSDERKGKKKISFPIYLNKYITQFYSNFKFHNLTSHTFPEYLITSKYPIPIELLCFRKNKLKKD